MPPVLVVIGGLPATGKSTIATALAWVGTAKAVGAELVEVEVICSDEDEHRRRAQVRSSDVEGLVKPAWAAIT